MFVSASLPDATDECKSASLSYTRYVQLTGDRKRTKITEHPDDYPENGFNESGYRYLSLSVFDSFFTCTPITSIT